MIDYSESYYLVIDNNNCIPNWVEINELLYDMCAWMYDHNDDVLRWVDENLRRNNRDEWPIIHE